jgi:hypothetical protein
MFTSKSHFSAIAVEAFHRCSGISILSGNFSHSACGEKKNDFTPNHKINIAHKIITTFLLGFFKSFFALISTIK